MTETIHTTNPSPPNPLARAAIAIPPPQAGVFLHPLFVDARRLLDAMPVIDSLDIRDEEIRVVAAIHAQRRLAEEATERLIALLDDLEPDPDLEPSTSTLADSLPSGALDECEPEDFIADDDGLAELRGEPALGWTAGVNQLGKHWHGKSASPFGSSPVEDGEEEFDGREPDVDDEPSLGVCYGDEPDLELDNSDSEPSLGSLDGRISQTTWASSDTEDREPNGDEQDGDSHSEDEPYGGMRSDPGDRAAADAMAEQAREMLMRKPIGFTSYEGNAVPIVGMVAR